MLNKNVSLEGTRVMGVKAFSKRFQIASPKALKRWLLFHVELCYNHGSAHGP